ncbi:MAG: MucB/RseB C-terminal domain-containing protein [Pseudomonadales bacterium]|nr:MucB/RseB C-terminal domain-containing protein [Pseudomonadales bacterium]
MNDFRGIKSAALVRSGAYSVKALRFILVAIVGILPHYAMAESHVDTVQILERMSNAFKNSSYDGVFIYSQGTDVKTLRVIHKVKNGVEKERLIHLDGKRFELIRDGEKLSCVVPKTSEGPVEHKVPPSSFAQSFVSNVPELEKNYHISEDRQHRFLDREVMQVSIIPKTNDRFSYQLWLDKTSGILLKSVLKNTSGDELERFQFSSLKMGGPIPDYLFMIENMNQARVVNISKTSSEKTRTTNKGWRVGWIPTGFHSIMSDEVEVAPTFMGNLEYMKAYSDGLFSFSILVEKIENFENFSSGEHSSTVGATTVMSRKFTDLKSNYSITLVGELPVETVKRILASVVQESGT